MWGTDDNDGNCAELPVPRQPVAYKSILIGNLIPYCFRHNGSIEFELFGIVSISFNN